MSQYSAENEAIHVLDDFICEAIPYPGIDADLDPSEGNISIPITCPSCGQQFRSAQIEEGKDIHCSHCGAAFSMPD